MQKIGKFSLKNKGISVVKLQFVYLDDDGKQQHVDGTGSFPLGQGETADPGKYGVPDGSSVALYVFIVWGKDSQAEQWFQYTSGSSITANYTITSTVLDDTLVLVSVA